MVKVKICGITSLEDGKAAVDAGADYIGFVFYPPSENRYINPVDAAKISEKLWKAESVGLFVDKDLNHVKDIIEIAGLDGESFYRGSLFSQPLGNRDSVDLRETLKLAVFK